MEENFDPSILEDINEEPEESSLEETETSPPEAPIDEIPEKPEESSEPEDDFDYSAPLSPREKILMERLERITGDNLSRDSRVPEEIAPPAVTPQERNFLENLDLDEVLSNSENLNQVLVAVYNKALEEASRLSAENIMRSLPGTISNYVSQHVGMAEMVKDFYTQNPDLVAVKRTVAAVANEVSAEHPEFTTEQIFDASAKKTREILKLQKVESPGVKTPSPAFAQSRGNRGSRMKAPVLSQIEKDVLELIRE